MTRTTDPLARDYRLAQVRRELDRLVRGVVLCGECDGEYSDDVSGRHRHRVLYGHPASRPGGEA